LSWIPSIGTTIEKQKHSLGLGCKRVSFCFSHVGMPFKWPSRTNGVVVIPSKNHTNLLLIYSLGSPNPMVFVLWINFLYFIFYLLIHHPLCLICFFFVICKFVLITAPIRIEDLENLLHESMLLTFNTEIEDGSIEQVYIHTFSISNFTKSMFVKNFNHPYFKCHLNTHEICLKYVILYMFEIDH